MRLPRRALFAAGLASPALAQPANARLLRYVPQSDLTGLDPVFSSGYITRHYAMMVYDQLYGLDSQLRLQPQMVEGHTLTEDDRLWTFRLREGLRDRADLRHVEYPPRMNPEP